MQGIGTVLALLWAAFWLYFALASGLSEGAGALALHLLVPGLVVAVPVLVMLRRPRAGGVLLALTALVVAVGYPLTMGAGHPDWVLFMLLAGALPPALAALLLLLPRRAPQPG